MVSSPQIAGNADAVTLIPCIEGPWRRACLHSCESVMTLKTNNLQLGTCNSGMESMSCEVLLPRGFWRRLARSQIFRAREGGKSYN
jgi:hypothetical protein